MSPVDRLQVIQKSNGLTTSYSISKVSDLFTSELELPQVGLLRPDVFGQVSFGRDLSLRLISFQHKIQEGHFF